MSSGRTFIILACSVLLSATAMAQETSPRSQGGAPAADSAQREETRRKVEALKLARLTEALKLDEKTAAKFIPAITVIGQQRREQMAEQRQAILDLRRQLNGPAVEEKKLRASVDRVFGSQREMMKLREKELETIRNSLTLEQQARYVVFQQEFMQEVRDVMRGPGHPRRPYHGGVPARGSAEQRRSSPPDAPLTK
jgi:Spy/CpxP family protein refolding chaperone